MSRGGVAGHPASISFLNRETRVVRLLLGPRFNGAASGSTEASEWSTFIGAGYDFHFGSLTFGPVASLQYTDIGIDDFSERGSLAIHSDSAESLRSDVGFRLFYQWQVGKIVVEPSLKAAWEHEYKYSALPITAGFTDVPGPSATFFGPAKVTIARWSAQEFRFSLRRRFRPMLTTTDSLAEEITTQML